MLLLLLQLDFISQLMHCAVDNDTHIAVFAQILQELLKFALAATHHRRQHLNLGAFRHGEDLIDHLLHGLRANGLPTLRTMRNPDAREQQSHIVIDFGHRSNSGARVIIRRLLINRNRRREAGDVIHIRLVHLSQKLPRIR